jgi:hypothetical protein
MSSPGRWSTGKSSRRRQPLGAVFCVGHRAFVHWPVQSTKGVPAFDRQGSPKENDLRDGQEVEILSWQPASRIGTLYEVRRSCDGAEWWLGNTQLRATAAAVAEAPSTGRERTR